jgi:hypothetical protein
VLESRSEFSEAADLANFNQNRGRELLVAIEPAANVARDAEVQLVAADCDDDRVQALGGNEVVENRPGMRVGAQSVIEAGHGGHLRKPRQPCFKRTQAGRSFFVHHQEFRQLAGDGERCSQSLFNHRLARFAESQQEDPRRRESKRGPPPRQGGRAIEQPR